MWLLDITYVALCLYYFAQVIFFMSLEMSQSIYDAFASHHFNMDINKRENIHKICDLSPLASFMYYLASVELT